MITSKFIRFAYAAVALCAAVCVKVCVGAEVQQVAGTKPADMVQRFYPVSDGFPYRIREAAEGIGEASRDFHACFKAVLGLFDVEWPDGSLSVNVKALGGVRVLNTPQNHAKIEAALNVLDAKPHTVELDCRFVEAGREALAAAGYFATNRVDGATLLSRLMARDDVKLLEAPRVAVTENCEATMKGLMLYRYPQDFDVMIGTGAEPQNFKEQEVGTILTVTPTLIRTSEKFFDLAVNYRLDGTPEWKNYGADAKWKKAKAYDLKMEQPFFRERMNIDSHVTVKPGTTVLLGGGADAPDGRSKAVLVFVTPRLAGKSQP